MLRGHHTSQYILTRNAKADVPLRREAIEVQFIFSDDTSSSSQDGTNLLHSMCLRLLIDISSSQSRLSPAPHRADYSDSKFYPMSYTSLSPTLRVHTAYESLSDR